MSAGSPCSWVAKPHLMESMTPNIPQHFRHGPSASAPSKSIASRKSRSRDQCELPLVMANRLYFHNLQRSDIQVSQISRLSVPNEEIRTGFIIQEHFTLCHLVLWRQLLGPTLWVWFYVDFRWTSPFWQIKDKKQMLDLPLSRSQGWKMAVT